MNRQTTLSAARNGDRAAARKLAGVVQTRCSDKGTGVFVAVVGASGAGKDTLIDHARAKLAGRSGLRFARRLVTRPAAGNEDYASLSPADFQQALRAKALALHWRANGLHYGIPAVADVWFASGDVVVANLSRAALPQALARYGRLAVIHVTVPPEILAARLSARGREDAADIARRLSRDPPLNIDPTLVLKLDNSGPPKRAGDALAQFLADCVSAWNTGSDANLVLTAMRGRGALPGGDRG